MKPLSPRSKSGTAPPKPALQTSNSLTDVLTEGSISAPSSPGARVYDHKQKFGELLETIAKAPIYAVVLSKCVDTADQDHLAKALVNVSRVTNSTLALLYELLKSEFEGTTNNTSSSILRGNSIATKVETSFCRSIGQEYLKDIFGDILLRIVTDTSLDLEVNLGKLKSKYEDAENVMAYNKSRLVELAQEFVDRFTSQESLDKMPRQIRAVAGYTFEFARRYCPAQVYPLLGGFVLLRFFNPAIIAPESLDLLPPGVNPNGTARNNLICITKLLQKLSNEVKVDVNDSSAWMNDFIDVNLEKMHNYLEELVTDPRCEQASNSKPNEEPRVSILCKIGSRSRTLRSDAPTVTGSYPWEDLKDLPAFKDKLDHLYSMVDSRTLVFFHRLMYEQGLSIFKMLEEYSKAGGVLHIDFLKMMMKLGRPDEEEKPKPVAPVAPSPDPAPKPPGTKGSWAKAKGNFLGLNRSAETASSPRATSIKLKGFVNKPSIAGFGPECDSTDIIGPVWFPPRTPYCDGEPLLPRFGQSAAVFHSTAWIFGGCLQDGQQISGPQSLIKLDLNTLRWEAIPLAMSPNRYYHSSFLYRNSFFIIGGISQKRYLNDMFRFDMQRKKWEKVEYSNEPPTPRYGHTTVIFEGIVYMFGGYAFDGDKSFYSNSLYMFDLEKRTWSTQISHNAPQGRMHHSASIRDRSMWIFGGKNEFNEPLNDLFRYDFDTRAWRLVGCRGVVPSPRWGHTLECVGSSPSPYDGEAESDVMYCMGGESFESAFNELYAFYFENQTWELLEPNGITVPPISLHSLVCDNGRMFVLFGGTYTQTGTLSSRFYELTLDVFHRPATEIKNHFALLIDNPEYHDVVFKVEGRNVYAHSVILMARCTPLLLLCQTARQQGSLIEGAALVPIFGSYDSFHMLISYIYTDELPLPSGRQPALQLSVVSELLSSCSRFSLARPARLLESYLMTILTVENLPEILDIAHTFDLRALKYCSLRFVCRNAKYFAKQEFLDSCDSLLVCQVAEEVFAIREKLNAKQKRNLKNSGILKT